MERRGAAAWIEGVRWRGEREGQAGGGGEDGKGTGPMDGTDGRDRWTGVVMGVDGMCMGGRA